MASLYQDFYYWILDSISSLRESVSKVVEEDNIPDGNEKFLALVQQHAPGFFKKHFPNHPITKVSIGKTVSSGDGALFHLFGQFNNKVQLMKICDNQDFMDDFMAFSDTLMCEFTTIIEENKQNRV